MSTLRAYTETNRCVLDRFGDRSDQALFQVGMEFTHSLDLDLSTYLLPSHSFPDLPTGTFPCHLFIAQLVYVHSSLHRIHQRLSLRQGRYNSLTPRHYLDL